MKCFVKCRSNITGLPMWLHRVSEPIKDENGEGRNYLIQTQKPNSPFDRSYIEPFLPEIRQAFKDVEVSDA